MARDLYHQAERVAQNNNGITPVKGTQMRDTLRSAVNDVLKDKVVLPAPNLAQCRATSRCK